MKQFGKAIKSKWKLAVLIFSVGLITLSGCLKDDNNEMYQVSAVRALNAIPGSDHLDIGLNESWLNYGLETGEVEDFAYRDTLPYKRAWPGTRVVRVFERGNITSNGLLAAQNVQFMPGMFYSLYVVGFPDDVELIRTEDDLSEPISGEAKIRFINLSPDAPALDLGVEGGDTLLTEDVAFKEEKGFSAIAVGETYTFHIIDHASGEVVHSFEFRPDNKGVYTVWARGLLQNDGNDEELGFGHELIVH